MTRGRKRNDSTLNQSNSAPSQEQQSFVTSMEDEEDTRGRKRNHPRSKQLSSAPGEIQKSFASSLEEEEDGAGKVPSQTEEKKLDQKTDDDNKSSDEAVETAVDTADGFEVELLVANGKPIRGVLRPLGLSDFTFTSNDEAGGEVLEPLQPSRRVEHLLELTLVDKAESALMAFRALPGATKAILFDTFAQRADTCARQKMTPKAGTPPTANHAGPNASKGSAGPANKNVSARSTKQSTGEQGPWCVYLEYSLFEPLSVIREGEKVSEAMQEIARLLRTSFIRQELVAKYGKLIAGLVDPCTITTRHTADGGKKIRIGIQKVFKLICDEVESRKGTSELDEVFLPSDASKTLSGMAKALWNHHWFDDVIEDCFGPAVLPSAPNESDGDPRSPTLEQPKKKVSFDRTAGASELKNGSVLLKLLGIDDAANLFQEVEGVILCSATLLPGPIDVATAHMSAKTQRMYEAAAKKRTDQSVLQSPSLFLPSSILDSDVADLVSDWSFQAVGSLQGFREPTTASGLLFIILLVLTEGVIACPKSDRDTSVDDKVSGLQLKRPGGPLNFRVASFFDQAVILNKKLLSGMPVLLIQDVRERFLGNRQSAWAYLLGQLLYNGLPSRHRYTPKVPVKFKTFYFLRVALEVERQWANWKEMEIQCDHDIPKSTKGSIASDKSRDAKRQAYMEASDAEEL